MRDVDRRIGLLHNRSRRFQETGPAWNFPPLSHHPFAHGPVSFFFFSPTGLTSDTVDRPTTTPTVWNPHPNHTSITMWGWGAGSKTVHSMRTVLGDDEYITREIKVGPVGEVCVHSVHTMTPMV